MAKIAVKRGEDEYQTTYECLGLLKPELSGNVIYGEKKRKTLREVFG